MTQLEFNMFKCKGLVWATTDNDIKQTNLPFYELCAKNV